MSLTCIGRDNKGRKRYLTDKGYILLRIKTNKARINKHGVNKGKATKLVLEHRIILEESGIVLSSKDSIHHKDLDRSNNKRHNLKKYKNLDTHYKVEHQKLAKYKVEWYN